MITCVLAQPRAKRRGDPTGARARTAGRHRALAPHDSSSNAQIPEHGDVGTRTDPRQRQPVLRRPATSQRGRGRGLARARDAGLAIITSTVPM